MRVRVEHTLSAPVQVSSGVPQGSVLGPILFILYINHVTHNLTCKFKIFADDIKIYYSYKAEDAHIAQTTIQRNIDILIRTSDSWNLVINQSKCTVMRFAPRNSALPVSGVSPYEVNNSILSFAETHGDLGIQIDNTLKFHSYIRRKVNSVSALTNNILSSTLCRDREFIINIYTSHVRPLLEYGSPVWNLGYVTDLKLLERVQRRWTREITGLEASGYASHTLLPSAVHHSSALVLVTSNSNMIH